MLELARGRRELATELQQLAIELAAKAGLVVCEIDAQLELARCFAGRSDAEGRERAAELEARAKQAAAVRGIGLRVWPAASPAE